jgi:hypothetical protein
MGFFLIASQDVGSADEGANGAEPRRVINAGIALAPIGRYGLGAEQPEATVGDDSAGIQEHGIEYMLRHGYPPPMRFGGAFLAEASPLRRPTWGSYPHAW